MKKAIVALVLGLMVMTTAAIAAKPNGPSAYNGLNKGNSDVKHLELYEKDPTTWEAIDGGARGRMTFDSDSFVFNGHGLEAGMDYTLIRYQDPWSGSPVCLASGTTNNGGNINLAGAMQDGGPKVWLVFSADVDCDNAVMTGWNPTEYLFEYNLI